MLVGFTEKEVLKKEDMARVAGFGIRIDEEDR